MTELSHRELEFLRRWRLLIDRLGGQKQAAEKMDWTTSTVSRDCSGQTLPTNERLRELCNFLRLAGDERAELEILLRHARDARRDRRKAPGETPPPPPDSSSPESAGQPENRNPRRRWVFAGSAAVVVVVAVVLVGVFVWPGGKSPHARLSATSSGVKGSYPGYGLKAVSIPMSSLIPALAYQLHQGFTKNARTVTGYEFRNVQNPGFCLTAADTGPFAGQDKGPVEIDACKATANQIWIPRDWDTYEQSYTHLVSAKYQTMCLNAQKTGGHPVSGNRVMLWTCYPAGNESWKFAVWYQTAKSRHHSYPICLNEYSLCIDTASERSVPGDPVRLMTRSAVAGQFWS